MRLSKWTGMLAAALAVSGGCSKGEQKPEERLADAASTLARFIAGYDRFDALDLADSVDLYVAPSEGAHARIARDQLREPRAWQVTIGDSVQSFMPRGLRTRVITDVGHYASCAPTAMSAAFPKLAAMPHVGVRLEPPQVKSCKETWNATFVFDTAGGRSRLVAAIYDRNAP